jgi:hypothetical protein
MTTMKDDKKEVSRREVLIGAGTIAAGAAVMSTGITGLVSKAKASGDAAYPYKKLDVNEVGRIAHETYFTKFCAETVLTGLFKPLAASVGEPYASFPLNSVFWAHGGLMGWGTACGTLIGAGTAVGLITAGDSKKVTTSGGRAPVAVGEAIINDVIAFYASENLPQYKPAAGQAKYEIKNQSISDTPICHISVGKWMDKEDVKFFGIERKERCARLSADIAMYTAKLLNEWADGTYKPRNEPLANALDNQITSQGNCSECHGDNVPTAKGA